MTEEQKQALIDEIAIQALRDDVRKWQQRAEAAEAKLAELEKQEPVAWLVLNSSEGYVESNPDVVAFLEAAGLTKCKPLFTRPAPAAGLAALVPDKWSLEQALKFVEDYTPPSEEESVLFAVNSFRAAILRNIEEAK